MSSSARIARSSQVSSSAPAVIAVPTRPMSWLDTNVGMVSASVPGEVNSGSEAYTVASPSAPAAPVAKPVAAPWKPKSSTASSLPWRT